MEKSIVIKLRDTLKQGKNLPLLVLVDNAFMNVNEADTARFTKWDDENGILYHWLLPTPHMQESYRMDTVTLYALSYEYIQGMQVVNVPVKYLGDGIDAIKASGCDISDKFKDLIINTYKNLTDPTDVPCSPVDYNNLISANRLDPEAPNAVNEVNDYYYNKTFNQDINVTRRTREYNESIKDELAAKEAARNNKQIHIDEDIKVDSDTNIVSGRKYTELKN